YNENAVNKKMWGTLPLGGFQTVIRIATRVLVLVRWNRAITGAAQNRMKWLCGLPERARFRDHTRQRLLWIQTDDLIERHPGERPGFLAHSERRATVGFEEKPDIVVQMFGLGAASGDDMDVDIKDVLRNRADRVQIRFLARLAQGDAKDIGIAIGMAAELEPLVQFAMMRQQGVCPVAIDNPGRARDMASLL